MSEDGGTLGRLSVARGERDRFKAALEAIVALYAEEEEHKAAHRRTGLGQEECACCIARAALRAS